MITSGGKRNPANLDRNGDTELWRRRISSACLSLSSVNATVPWRYHLDREQHRVHQVRYLNNTIPRAA
jgi:hypothetical protein